MLNLRLRSKQSQGINLKICLNYVNVCLTVKWPMNWKH